MSQKPSYFRIGLFVVVALAILAGGLIAFGAGQMFRPRVYVETYINGTVQGVDVGSPVKFRGVPIGRVSSINFTFNEYGDPSQVDRFNYVFILMEIDREMFPGMFRENLTPIIEKNVAQGLRARIEPQGVTGINYIEINYVNDPNQFPPLAVNWKPHYYYIPSAPGQLTNMLDSINNIMRQIEELNIGGMINSLTELLANLNKAVTGADITKVSTDLRTLVGEFRHAVKAANIGGVSEDARRLFEAARQMVDDLEKSNTQLRAVLRNLEPATRISGPQIRELVQNLTIASENFAQFSAEVKRRPSLLLWGTPPQAKPTPTPRRRR
jgi:phospholipid/cholesterol/gamma-HCH transport system substrate-binding protein